MLFNLPIDNGIIGLAGFGLIFKDSTMPRIRLIVFSANLEDLIFHDVRPLFETNKCADELEDDEIREFSKPVVSIITQWLLFQNCTCTFSKWISYENILLRMSTKQKFTFQLRSKLIKKWKECRRRPFFFFFRTINTLHCYQ